MSWKTHLLNLQNSRKPAPTTDKRTTLFWLDSRGIPLISWHPNFTRTINVAVSTVMHLVFYATTLLLTTRRQKAPCRTQHFTGQNKLQLHHASHPQPPKIARDSRFCPACPACPHSPSPSPPVPHRSFRTVSCSEDSSDATPQSVQQYQCMVSDIMIDGLSGLKSDTA